MALKDGNEEDILREVFAVAALIALGRPAPPDEEGKPLSTEAYYKRRAEWAYAQADAMLAARKAKKP